MNVFTRIAMYVDTDRPFVLPSLAWASSDRTQIIKSFPMIAPLEVVEHFFISSC
jgi:hypothetical protein